MCISDRLQDYLTFGVVLCPRKQVFAVAQALSHQSDDSKQLSVNESGENAFLGLLLTPHL